MNQAAANPMMKSLYLDFHTHILPAIDDGSSSVDMSMQMLRQSVAQGVCGIVLTPHFYSHRDTIDRFLDRRRQALAQLTVRCRGRSPILLPGAEVYYFRDMAHVSELAQLRIHNTSLFLLEMPFKRWTDAMIDDVLQLQHTPGMSVVLAHIDRYLDDQPRGLFEMLADHGVMMQVNAEAFCNSAASGRVLNLFGEGMIRFLGSDCHNLTTRPPRMADAIEVLCTEFGTERVNAFARESMRCLLDARLPTGG